MAEHNETGKHGEAVALKLLKKKGYRIRETNFRYGRDEIDIVAETNDQLIIVEVKTRSSNKIISPEVAVNKQKQRFMIRAAHAYINWKRINKETRFDIIAVLITSDGEQVIHIEDAFYPTL